MKGAVFCAALATVVSPALADPRYECRVDDSSGSVTCNSDEKSVPAFEFKLNAAVPLKSSLVFEHPLTCENPDEYRLALEEFRKSDLERFRTALEGLRVAAESVKVSADIGLYQEIIDRYGDLLQYYYGGQRSYQNAINQYGGCWYPKIKPLGTKT